MTSTSDADYLLKALEACADSCFLVHCVDLMTVETTFNISAIISLAISEFRKVFRFVKIFCPDVLPTYFHLKILFA